MKKIFDGMTPDQIWEYIKNLSKEEQDKLLFELDNDDMKKIRKKNPKEAPYFNPGGNYSKREQPPTKKVK